MAKALTAQEIRDSFTGFFVKRDHRSLPSSPLVPIDDPTLLFTSAGMVQFKPMFAATGSLEYTRATTIQKCFRATDLEQVGHTPRHLSFFEMLGNFSFGDYFKREAIEFAWEYVTQVLEMDTSKIWVTVYLDDDEAADIWHQKIGIPKSRLVRLGKEDNFWGPAGATGACGPSSEIYYDLGQKIGCGAADCAPGCDCDRFQEFWNLVFPQFNQDKSGTLGPLPKPGIDTGLGLERLAQLLQGVSSVFETEGFKSLRNALGDLTSVDLDNPDHVIARNVVIEHARSLTMLLAEGVYPSNEGRGYVARRLLRRAARRGRVLGLHEPFLYRLTGVAVDSLHQAYPDLIPARERIAKICKAEETRFLETLETGMRRFAEVVERTRTQGKSVLSGVDAFTLYDTFGFPLDMTQEMAEEAGISVDQEGFEKAMQGQVERSRTSAQFNQVKDEMPFEWLADQGEAENSAYVGYDSLETAVTILGRRKTGDGWDVILDTTPFYAEGGGQVGDRGELVTGDGAVWKVMDVRKQGSLAVHHLMGSGEAPSGRVAARVDQAARRATERNHTATHLLQAALRRVLGDHVTQAGSLVSPDRLRFDFSHFASMTDAQLEAIEADVNGAILSDFPVQKEVTSMEEARRAGAMAMFGEKYGDTVRQVFVVGDNQEAEVTRELCGGCHVRQTGEIGVFRIVSQESVAAGIRRVEAVTGWNALGDYRAADRVLARLEGVVHAASKDDLGHRVEALVRENESLKKELSKLRSQEVQKAAGALKDQVQEVDGVAFISAEVPAETMDDLRRAADKLRDQLGSAVGVLAARIGKKATFVAFVTPDLLESRSLRADRLVRDVAKIAGGGGGGRPEFATAGAKDLDKVEEALSQVGSILKEHLAGKPA